MNPLWPLVVALGALGGFVGTLLPGGTAVPLPAPLHELIGRRPKVLLLFHLIRNVICGALASLITWLMYSPSSGVAVAQDGVGRIVVASLISGGAGASVITSLFASAAKDRVIDNLTDALHDSLAERGPLAATDSGDARELPEEPS